METDELPLLQEDSIRLASFVASLTLASSPLEVIEALTVALTDSPDFSGAYVRIFATDGSERQLVCDRVAPLAQALVESLFQRVYPQDISEAWIEDRLGVKAGVTRLFARGWEGLAVSLSGEAPDLLSWLQLTTGLAVLSLDRLTAEEKLRDVEQDHRKWLDANPHVAWTGDKFGNITDFSQRWLELTGMTREQAEGSGWQEAVFPEDLGLVADTLTQAVGDGNPVDFEFRIVLSSGDVRWVRTRAVPRRDERGAILSWDGFTEDIHDRKEAELKLRQREIELESLVDAMPHIAWIADSSGRNTYLNRRWADYTSSVATKPDRIGDFVHPEDLAASTAEWATCIRESREFSGELRLANQEGMYRWHLTRAVPVLDSNGSVARWIGTATDIHELREKQAEVRQLNQELEKRVQDRTEDLLAANQELESITYTVAHDLRAPLRTIVATADILREEAEGYLNFDQMSMLQRQGRSARHLSSLIDELLSFARLARTKVFRTKVDLSAVASEVVEDLSADQLERHLRIEIQPGMRASADGRLVQLVLLNLIDNAMKFSPDGGRVVIGQATGESTPTFFVRDEGIGFSLAEAANIFKPFERLVPSADYAGTGIGLANVQRIVHLHGGRVWAESMPAAGSTFYFTLGESSAA